jgi:hypothetical protein
MDFELTPAQQALRMRARELADGVFAGRAARWDEREEYPWDNVKEVVAAGFMGMTIPTEYGGGDTPVLDVILVIEEIARACGVTARIVVEGNLGVVGALRAYGTQAQKRRYFPWVVQDGEKPPSRSPRWKRDRRPPISRPGPTKPRKDGACPATSDTSPARGRLVSTSSTPASASVRAPRVSVACWWNATRQASVSGTGSS